MVILGVDNEQHLEFWEQKLKELGLKYYAFTESYFNNAKTALAVEPVDESKFFIFKGLNLL